MAIDPTFNQRSAVAQFLLLQLHLHTVHHLQKAFMPAQYIHICNTFVHAHHTHTHTHTRTLTLTGAFNQYLANRKNKLVQSMLQVFGVYFRPYVTLYDDFYAYLQQTISTGNMCQLETRFKQVFFEIFLAAYFSNPTSVSTLNPLNTELFRTCVYNYFLELKGRDILTWYTGFTRSYNRTMYYFHALRTADAILESLLSHRLTNSCKTTLMKMSHCAQCAGYEDTTHCQGMCLNSLRGCLIDLADLAGPFREFSDAVVQMRNSLEDVYNPWVQFNILEAHFYSILGTSFAQASEVSV